MYENVSNSSIGYEYFKKNDELEHGFLLLVYMLYIYEETQTGGIILYEQ